MGIHAFSFVTVPLDIAIIFLKDKLRFLVGVLISKSQKVTITIQRSRRIWT